MLSFYHHFRHNSHFRRHTLCSDDRYLRRWYYFLLEPDYQPYRIALDRSWYRVLSGLLFTYCLRLSD